MSSMNSKLQDRLRGLPGVDAVSKELDPSLSSVSPKLITVIIRQVIEEAREDLKSGRGDAAVEIGASSLAARVQARLQDLTALRPMTVINATGVLIHTNLGRSPLAGVVVDHMSRVASGYSDLEYDLKKGGRGSRHDHVRDLLLLLTGAEAGLVVNNNAAAVLLALGALAKGKEVILSRGEMVEIGGSFRVPEILEQSGARLREVGTTNRTHLKDYEKAIGKDTGLLLRVHASNYRIEGFTAEVELKDLVTLGREHGIPVMVDLGSGAFLDVSMVGIQPEPLVREVVEQGPDLVTFSGDKLMGGPQAGLVVGKKETVESLRQHPLARAVRIDKLLLAALQATLALYLDEDKARREIPILKMLFQPAEIVCSRAEALATAIKKILSKPAPQVMVENATAAVGGGALPLEGLTTSVVVLDPRPHTNAARLERALRHVQPAVLGRVREDQVFLDLRTVTVEEEGHIPALIQKAWTTAIQGE